MMWLGLEVFASGAGSSPSGIARFFALGWLKKDSKTGQGKAGQERTHGEDLIKGAGSGTEWSEREGKRGCVGW